MSKAFLLLGRTGDLIGSLPIFKAESESTGAPVNVLCLRQYAPLFGGTSYVNCVPFDGADSELRKAYDLAKTQFDEVVSLQVIGNTNDVKDCTYGPAGFQSAQTDSFQKEPYWLAKRKDLWAKQVRPVFDGRSKAREKKLLESSQGEWWTSKSILVASAGKSSPFPYKDLLMELLMNRFRDFTIVDLSSFKADRFYDFIGLLERTRCLVTIDSAFLHLAHAVPNLPVCALTNDAPNLWFGSTWRANHISHIRYSDFPFRAVEMLDAIEGINKVGSYFLTPATTGPRIIHVWSRYDETDDSKERGAAARATWNNRYLEADWVSCPIEVGAIGRDSKTHEGIKDEHGRFPFLRDVIRLASYRASDDDVIMLTRCDACLAPNLTEQLMASELPAYAHRNYRENGEMTWHPMVDLFAFTKKWWNEHKAEVPDFFLAPDQFWNKTVLGLFIKLGAREILEGVYRAPSKARAQGGKRKEYNQNLFNEYQLAHGEICLFKSVIEQLPSVVVNPQALAAYAYNPSIVQYQNRLLMAHRYHDQRDFSTALSIAEIDEKGVVYGRKQLQVPHMGGSEEDARFFIHKDELWLCYVDSTYPAVPAKAVVKYGKLVEDTAWAIPQIFHPNLPGNDMTSCQKNVVMWEHQGKVVAIYQTSPKTMIYDMQADTATLIAEYDGPRWSYGAIRGGTTPLPYEGKLLRFFHSAVDTELEPDRRRYFCGAMLMESEPPFKPVVISKRPVLYGSEKDGLTATQRSACFHYKPKVVFPLGAIAHADGWLLSVGVNDNHCALVYVTEKDLNL